MTRLPIANLIMILALYALAAVQMVLSYEFWSSFGGVSLLYGIAFKVFGVCLALIEIVILLVASHAALRGQPISAVFGRLLFTLILALNFGLDLAAISTFIDRDANVRSSEAVEYDQAAATVAEIDGRIPVLRAQLQARDLDLPATALAPLVVNAREAVADEGVTPQTRRWRQRRLADLESALHLAEEIERLEAQRARARDALNTPRPETEHAAVTALIGLLAPMGIEASPHYVRTGVAVAMALVLRLALGFGFWVAFPSQRPVEGAPDTRADQPEEAVSRPTAEARFIRWPFPQRPRTRSSLDPDGDGPILSSPPPPMPPPPRPRSPDGEAGQGPVRRGPRRPGAGDNPRRPPPRDPLDDLDPAT